MSFLQRSWNVGNLLVVLGVLALVLTFVWPYLTARRVARVESWATDIVTRLLAAGADDEDPRVAAPGEGERLLAQLTDRHIADRLRPLPLDKAEQLPPGLYFEGKHFYYLLTAEEDPDAAGSSDRLEVYAWPRTQLSPSRSAFYADADGQRAYTHNLRARYTGLTRVPRAGVARWTPDEDGTERSEVQTYRGTDEEHWVPTL